MTPEEFAEKMGKIFSPPKKYDNERAHVEADDLMCDLLRKLGYEAGVEIFSDAELWYA
jgi:hypothetical protein